MSQAQPPIADPLSSDVPQEGAVVGRSPWELFRRRFRRDRTALAGLVFLIGLIVVALSAPIIAGWVGRGPNTLNGATLDDIGLPSVGPGSDYFFGVDTSGRDVFLRTVYGARTSLLVAFLATGLATVIATILGLIAGYRGGWVDTLVSRVMDLVLSVPLVLFSIGIAGACSVTVEGCLGGFVRPGISLVVTIITLFTWPYIGRIVRGQVISIREREYIESARAIGSGTGRILLREVLPNLAAPIIVVGTLTIPTNILFESALSYLGVGVPSSTPSWGRMISEASAGQLFTVAWWMLAFPGLALVLTTLAFNLLGDGLRDALDPRTAS